MTFLDSLIGTVDDARSVLDDLGLRPYRVFLVWMGWTADENADGMVNTYRDAYDQDLGTPEEFIEALAESDLEDELVGVGRPVLLREVELLPRPLVSLGGVGKMQDSMGLTERGGAGVTRISMKYSEDFLMGLVAPFRDPEHPDSIRKGIDFFWEVRDERECGFVPPGHFADPTARQELPPPRRRFHVSGTPTRQPDAFQWSIGLTRADGERARGGSVDEVG